MSVLIRGMEMPTNCGYCPLRHEARDGDECWLGAELTEYQKRPDDCPLVPVPPHGDLVDRQDAIIDANKRAYDFWLSDDEVNATIQFLNEQSTIIPASEEGMAWTIS